MRRFYPVPFALLYLLWMSALRFRCLLIGGCYLLLLVHALGRSDSVLKWAPGRAEAPEVAVEVQWLMKNDYLFSDANGLGKLKPLEP